MGTRVFLKKAEELLFWLIFRRTLEADRPVVVDCRLFPTPEKVVI